MIGAIPAPMGLPYSVDYFLKNFIDPLEARAIFTSPLYAGELAAKGVEPLCFASPKENLPKGVLRLEETVDLPFNQALEILQESESRVSIDDVVIIQATSGSTGKPKLVKRTHHAPARYAEYVGRELEEDPSRADRFLFVASLVHAFGFHMMTTAIARGATLCVTTLPDIAADLEEVRLLDPTVLPLVPRVQQSLYRQYSHQAEETETGPFLGPSAHYVCSAGGTPDADALNFMMSQGLTIIEYYGSTEASLVAVTPRGQWQSGCAGRVVEDAEVSLAEDGELLVKSEGVTSGYHGESDLTREAFTESGLYRTGDLAELRAGYLYIKGRKRDVFNTADGSNIFPARIETMMENLTSIHQAILFGDQRPYLIALIVLSKEWSTGLNPEMEPSPGELAALCWEVAEELVEMNRRLEKMEQVVRFRLFSKPFPEEVYATAGQGKINRNRRAAAKIFASAIDDLYRSDRPPDLDFVPGAESSVWSFLNVGGQTDSFA